MTGKINRSTFNTSWWKHFNTKCACQNNGESWEAWRYWRPGWKTEWQWLVRLQLFPRLKLGVLALMSSPWQVGVLGKQATLPTHGPVGFAGLNVSVWTASLCPLWRVSGLEGDTCLPHPPSLQDGETPNLSINTIVIFLTKFTLWKQSCLPSRKNYFLKSCGFQTGSLKYLPPDNIFVSWTVFCLIALKRAFKPVMDKDKCSVV